MVAALAGAGEDFYRGGLAAEENDAGFGKELLDGDGRFDAVDVGHEDVGEDELGVDAAGGVDGFPATVGGFGEEAAAVEDLYDGVGDERFVVDYEDAGGSSRARAVSVCVERRCRCESTRESLGRRVVCIGALYCMLNVGMSLAESEGQCHTGLCELYVGRRWNVLVLSSGYERAAR